MAVTWTKEQQTVIDLRNQNILVSAAAGSGKTAVLVERILSLVTDPVHPVDVDRLLIMTFTRAAAGEMRTRLATALEERLEADPDNEHLKRQTLLIHSAQITTIHGFCGYVIQNYFPMLELDPGYRVADAGESSLLMEDVAKEVVDQAYEQEGEDFVRFVESYAFGKNDGQLEKLILQLYEFAMSHPWPKDCLQKWEQAYGARTPEEMRQAPWMQYVWSQAEKYLREAEEMTRENLALALSADGPYMYEKALEADLAFVESLQESQAFDTLWKALEKPGWTRLSPVRDEGVSEQKKEQVQAGRQAVKDLLAELGSTFFPMPEEEVRKTMEDCQVCIQVLHRLVLTFMQAYGEKKREKNMVDFSDLEHFALDILLKQEDGQIRYTQAARELSLRYEEVMVDEYQDSNLVQEYLLNAVSGWARGQHNTFMVGDVKQSIYRFRLARPELFMEKFRAYTLEEGENRRVDLFQNFRSRPQVLESVNYLFRQIMGEELGGVAYDDRAALYPGAQFPEGGREAFCTTEVMLLPTGEEERGGAAGSDREWEALAIAGRIQKIVGREQVLDKKTGTYRPAGYGDVVILLRTMEGWADTFAKVLGSQGIPAYTTSKTGYFSALEVVTVLHLLRICDNPRQEVPYTAVLHSPFVGCSTEELALIHIAAPEQPIYEAVPYYAEAGADEALRQKLQAFLSLLETLRRQVPYTPIHQFIRGLLDRTGYEDYVSALPGGPQRQANLDMLVEKAMEYEQTSYRGLFHFVRYIDSLQTYKMDFGEVKVSEGTDTVEIMSIHKSKGLEFPIVFVAGMGKQFNTQELKSPLILHQELGVGADAIYPKERAKLPTLLKEMIRVRTKDENLGEELRVLYVALTRAKEKLILTGTVRQLKKKLLSYASLQDRQQELFSYGFLTRAHNYWDWVLPALMRHRDMGPVLEEYDMTAYPGTDLYEAEASFEIYTVRPEHLAYGQMGRQLLGAAARERLLHWEETPREGALFRELQERFSYTYPYEAWKNVPVKVSVSELKHQQTEGETDSYAYYFEPDVVPLIPKFVQETEAEPAGSARGTAYHRVMECLDYRRIKGTEIRDQVAEMVQSGRLEEEAASWVNIRDIVRFTGSELGSRMQAADGQGLLFRERPFVFTRLARELDPSWPEEEKVLVQGIIDAYFIEEDGIVLVDYKTDKIRKGQEQKLIDLYQVQLYSYGEALAGLTGKPVKEIYLYSFTLGEAIALPAKSR